MLIKLGLMQKHRLVTAGLCNFTTATTRAIFQTNLDGPYINIYRVLLI